MAGPLAVGQQVLYERAAARAGSVVRVEHPTDIGPACAVDSGAACAVDSGTAGIVDYLNV